MAQVQLEPDDFAADLEFTDMTRPDPQTSKPARLLRWWRGPFWLLQLVTGAKSFVDNPILGSRRLNEVGLHLWRVRTAHRLARRRRRRLAHLISPDLRGRFDRDGYVCIEDFLPADQFERLRSAVLNAEMEARSHQQGDTVTRRVPIGPQLRRAIPELDRLLDQPDWTGLLAYVASTRTTPLYYVQTILGGAAPGAPDPQVELHSDTFHPSLKAWLFLTDVDDAGRPLTYVPGSHSLSPGRLAWEKRKSVEVLERGDRLSQRGSFRVTDAELKHLRLGPPVRFAVRANTLVAVDTCGFHARAASDRPTLRVELWAYCRRTPFIPWTGGDPLSLRPLAGRRAQWLASAVDWLDRRGLMQQHWKRAGRKRPADL